MATTKSKMRKTGGGGDRACARNATYGAERHARNMLMHVRRLPKRVMFEEVDGRGSGLLILAAEGMDGGVRSRPEGLPLHV